MTQPRDFPYIYVTWLAGLLSGDRNCEWSVWFKAHWQGFAKIESDFNFAKWKRDHTTGLNAKRDELISNGYTVWMEDQNKFNWRGQVATLGGKSDLVAGIRPQPEVMPKQLTVFDYKSGKPKDSDMLQVQLYMWALPRAVERYRSIPFDGRVVYADHEVEIPANTITPEFRGQVKELILRLADSTPAYKVPAFGECRWCDITLTDCEERIETEEQTAITDEF